MSDCGDIGAGGCETGDIDVATAGPAAPDQFRHRRRTKPSRLNSWYRGSRPRSEDRHSSHHSHSSSPDSRYDDSYPDPHPDSHRSHRKSREHRHRDFDADADAMVRHQERHREEYGVARRGRRSRSVDEWPSSESEEEVYDRHGRREYGRSGGHGERGRYTEERRKGFGTGLASKEGLAIAGVVMVASALFCFKDDKKKRRR